MSFQQRIDEEFRRQLREEQKGDFKPRVPLTFWLPELCRKALLKQPFMKRCGAEVCTLLPVDLDRAVDINKPCKVFDLDPNEGVWTFTPGFPPLSYYGGPRYRIVFDRLYSVRLSADTDELASRRISIARQAEKLIASMFQPWFMEIDSRSADIRRDLRRVRWTLYVLDPPNVSFHQENHKVEMFAYATLALRCGGVRRLAKAG